MNQEISILVVDDNPDILFLTSRTLKKAGYKVTTASDGKECMTIVQANQPDLMIMDVMLPDIKGTELCRRFKADPVLKKSFIVLMSGTVTSSEDQGNGLELGADGYIAKSISSSEFLARVNAMVRIVRAEKERDQLIIELEDALQKVKQLKGLLPICAFCKKIRDDKGYWNRLEDYISTHTDADFSHSICEECLDKHYPEKDDQSH